MPVTFLNNSGRKTYPFASKCITNFCTRTQASFKMPLFNSNHLFDHQKHCLYFLHMIWDKSEPYLICPEIFICE